MFAPRATRVRRTGVCAQPRRSPPARGLLQAPGRRVLTYWRLCRGRARPLRLCARVLPPSRAAVCPPIRVPAAQPWRRGARGALGAAVSPVARARSAAPGRPRLQPEPDSRRRRRHLRLLRREGGGPRPAGSRDPRELQAGQAWDLPHPRAEPPPSPGSPSLPAQPTLRPLYRGAPCPSGSGSPGPSPPPSPRETPSCSAPFPGPAVFSAHHPAPPPLGLWSPTCHFSHRAGSLPLPVRSQSWCDQNHTQPSAGPWSPLSFQSWCYASLTNPPPGHGLPRAVPLYVLSWPHFQPSLSPGSTPVHLQSLSLTKPLPGVSGPSKLPTPPSQFRVVCMSSNPTQAPIFAQSCPYKAPAPRSLSSPFSDESTKFRAFANLQHTPYPAGPCWSSCPPSLSLIPIIPRPLSLIHFSHKVGLGSSGLSQVSLSLHRYTVNSSLPSQPMSCSKALAPDPLL